MKRTALPLLILTALALSPTGAARADDLFYEDGRVPVGLTLVLGKTTYHQVQIVRRFPDGRVEIITRGDVRHVLPRGNVPPSLTLAIDRREGRPQGSAGIPGVGGPGRGDRGRKIKPSGVPAPPAPAPPPRPQEAGVRELTAKIHEMQNEASERCWMPVTKVVKNNQVIIPGVFLGFRKERQEVLFSNYFEVAWVPLGYFAPETARWLTPLDLNAEEAKLKEAGKQKALETAKNTPSLPTDDPNSSPPIPVDNTRRLPGSVTDLLPKDAKDLLPLDVLPKPQPPVPRPVPVQPDFAPPRTLREIQIRFSREWPDHPRIQTVEVLMQHVALKQLTAWKDIPPFGLTNEESEKLRQWATADWPGDYRTQVISIRERARAMGQPVER